jgi:hypothetical protein
MMFTRSQPELYIPATHVPSDLPENRDGTQKMRKGKDYEQGS